MPKISQNDSVTVFMHQSSLPIPKEILAVASHFNSVHSKNKSWKASSNVHGDLADGDLSVHVLQKTALPSHRRLTAGIMLTLTAVSGNALKSQHHTSQS